MRANIRMERGSRHEHLELAVDGNHVALARREGSASTATCRIDAHPSPREAEEAYRGYVLHALAHGYVPVRAARSAI